MIQETVDSWVLLMVGVMITHGRLGQFSLMLLNFAYLATAALVAWGRFILEPFTD